jgi:vancomycin resistance protein YoaR
LIPISKGKFEASGSSSRSPEKKPKAAKKKGGKKIPLIVTAVVVAVLLAGFAGFYIYSASVAGYEYIFPNVYVAGVNVGGMTKLAAIDAVNEAVSETYGTQTLVVQLEDRTLSFTPEQTKVALDAESAIEEAWAYGREGSVFKIASAYRAAKKSDHFIELQTNLNLDTAYIRQIINEAAAEVASELKESAVSINEEEGYISVVVGTAGRSLDAEKLYDVVIAAFENNDFTPIEFAYDSVSFNSVDLDTLYRDMCVEKVDAYYDEETHTIVEESAGYGFDLEAAKQQLALAEEGTVVQIPFGTIEPEVTAAELEEELFGTELSSYSSPHTAIAARTNNLSVACAAIDGTILNPGETFSFNNIVGERTADKGYLAAAVYVSGDTVPELGGGVCQVASTIYMCTLEANLEVVERSEHMYAVTYVPMGMDATIYWGSLDYKFKNSTSSPLKITANVSGGYVNIAFYGVPDNDYRVDLHYETLSTTPFKVVDQNGNEISINGTEVTMTDKDGTHKGVLGANTVTAYTGYNIMAYRDVYDSANNLISSEKTYSHYDKRDKVYEVTYLADEPEPDPEPTPDPGTNTGSGSDTNTGSGTGSDTNTGSGSGTNTGSGSDTNTGSDANTDSGSDTTTDTTTPDGTTDEGQGG